MALILATDIVCVRLCPQDILEKIRECGSSVTYYGGRVLNNQSPEMSPMTKAIMREIHSDDNVCEVCQPNKCPHSSKIFTSFCGRGAADNKHLGKDTKSPLFLLITNFTLESRRISRSHHAQE